MVRKLLGSKRAVSPVVASLLMIVITVAGFGLVLTTTNRWISIQRINEMQVIRERLIIEDAWFRPDNYLWLVVTNVGRIELRIRYVQVDEVTLIRLDDLELIRLKIGNTERIDINLTQPWTGEKEYLVRIITNRGNRFEAVFWSPSN